MRRITTLFMIFLFTGAVLASCGSTEEIKKEKGLTKEQRERIDRDKKDFEKKLPEEEDDG